MEELDKGRQHLNKIEIKKANTTLKIFKYVCRSLDNFSLYQTTVYTIKKLPLFHHNFSYENHTQLKCNILQKSQRAMRHQL